MKLTKDQRHTAYIIMLAESSKLKYPKALCEYLCFNDNKRSGLCKLSKVLFGIELEDWADEITKDNVISPYIFLWPTNTEGWKHRISLLEECIAKTYNF